MHRSYLKHLIEEARLNNASSVGLFVCWLFFFLLRIARSAPNTHTIIGLFTYNLFDRLLFDYGYIVEVKK